MVDETTVSDSPIAVARVLFYSVIIVAVVLFANVLAVLLLNLLMDIDIWLTLLFWEGLIMIMFGAVGIITSIAYGSARHHVVGWKGIRIIHAPLKEKVSNLEVSITVAGVVLIILRIFVGLQFF